jgi:beta propeller repeat protein
MRIRSLVALCVFAAIAAAPSASGATGFTWTESVVTVASGDQLDPAISGPTITYTDTSAGTADVRYFDTTTGMTHTVAAGPGDQQLSDVSDGGAGLVVYTGSGGGPADIFSYELATGTTAQLTSSPADQINPAVSSQLVAYEDYSSGGSDICRYSRLDSTTACLSKPWDQVSPAVSGASVVYIDVAAGSSVVVWNTASGATQTLDAGPASAPDIDGTHVVYARAASGGNDIATHDLTTNTRKVLTLAGDQVNPHISGDWVSFEDLVTGVSHLGLWNYVTGEVQHPNVSAASQSLNDISGNRVVYMDNRNGSLDIYSLQFTAVPPDTTPPTLHLPATIVVDATSPAGAAVSYAASAFDDRDGSVAVSCMPASGSTFAIGTTHVACSAHDAANNLATGGFDVVVRGAVDQLDALIARVKALGLKPGTQATLLAELYLAKSALAAQKPGFACLALRIFVVETNLLSGRTIAPSDATALAGDATRIEAVVPC